MTYYKDRTANEFHRLLWFLLGGSRGGENRAKIICALRSRPHNVNQVAKMLNVDYRSVQHHIRVLTKNSLVIGSGGRYGMTYSIHPWLEHNIYMFDEICNKMGFSSKILEEDHLLVEAQLIRSRRKGSF